MLTILQHPAFLIQSQQPVVFKVQSDATGSPLRIGGGVTSDSGGDIIPADGDKKATFELSDWLQGLITERGKTANVPAVYSGVPRQLTFSFLEWIGNPQATGDDIETPTYWLLDGRVPASISQAFYAAHASLLAYLVSTKRFLSWWPAGETRKVLPLQHEFLNFLQLSSQSPITITLKLLLTFTDATSAEQTAFTVLNCAYMQLVYFPTGATQLGIPIIMSSAYPDKMLASYSVYVKSGSSLISEVVKYQVDDAWYQNPRFLWVRNGFGLWEVLLCTGQASQENEIKPEQAITDGQSLPDKLNWKTTKTDAVKVNTGFKPEAVMQWISDLDFREAYEMIGGNLVPIVMHDLKLPVVHDGIYQYSADLEYEYVHYENIEQG